MLQRIRGILHPEAYHGHLFEPPYFEGWYVKLVDANVNERLIFERLLLRLAGSAIIAAKR